MLNFARTVACKSNKIIVGKFVKTHSPKVNKRKMVAEKYRNVFFIRNEHRHEVYDVILIFESTINNIVIRERRNITGTTRRRTVCCITCTARIIVSDEIMYNTIFEEKYKICIFVYVLQNRCKFRNMRIIIIIIIGNIRRIRTRRSRCTYI